MIVPAEEHRYAASEDVESGLLLLHHTRTALSNLSFLAVAFMTAGFGGQVNVRNGHAAAAAAGDGGRCCRGQI